MTPGQTYRDKADEFAAKSKAARNPQLQAQHAGMAAAYLRLAEQADRNAVNNLSCDPSRQES